MINGAPSRWPKTIAKSSAVVVFFLSLLVFGNWAIGPSRFQGLLPASPKMAAGTAVLFLLLGLAVWLGAMDLGANLPNMSTPQAAPRVRVWLSKSCAAITVCVALLRLFGHLMAREFGLDRLWFLEGVGAPRAQMAPATCVSFILIGCGLLLVRSSRYSKIFQGVVLLGSLVAWLGLSHYIFGGQPLLPFSQMAIHTAFSFLVICLGILCLRPDVGLVALLSSDTEGGVLARRLVPSALFVPLVIGLLRLHAQRAGWFGTEAGVSVFALANVVIFGGLIWANAAILHRTDAQRRKAETALGEGQHRLRNILDSLFTFVGLLSEDGVLLEVNRAPLEVAGVQREDAIGKSVAQTYWFSHSAEAQDRVRVAVKRAATGETVRYDEVIRIAGDQRATIDLTFCPLRDDSGSVVQVVASAMDITERKGAEEALRESAASLKEAQRIAQLGSFVFDFANETWKSSRVLDELLGIDAGWERSLAGWLALVHPDDRTRMADYAEIGAIGRTATFNNEYRIIRPLDHAERWLWTQAVLERDAEGRAVNMHGTSMDITERKLVQESLRESEAKFSTAFHINSVAMAIATLDGKMVEVNEAFCGLVGYTREEIIGNTSPEIGFMTADAREKMARAIEEAAGALRNAELTFRAKDGSLRNIVQSIAAISLGGVPHRLATMIDVTERNQAEQELRATLEQLHALSARLQAAREEERTVVARELHDEIGQVLTALKFDISWLARRLPTNQKELVDKVDAALALADTGHQWVRKICTQLRPGVLDDLGLMAAIEWQARDFEERTNISCSVDSWSSVIDLDHERATAVFRIFQETLTNVSRHSEASHVDVSLREESGTLLLVVKDNGKGIDGHDLSQKRSFGLMGMRERALVFGGRVEFSGIRGKGTTVSVFIPLSTQQEKEGAADANPAGR